MNGAALLALGSVGLLLLAGFAPEETPWLRRYLLLILGGAGLLLTLASMAPGRG